jgi:folate-binding protein YgfZ
MVPFAAWIDRDVVRASGPDTITFLQGQLSQDVASMDASQSRWSLLLAPTGKIDAWLRVTRTGDDEFELDTDAGFGEAVVQRLSRFKLRTKCEFDVVQTVKCIAVRGQRGDGLPIVWPGTEGYDLLGVDAAPEGLEVGDGYEELRIRSGVPAMGRELTESTIPVEAGQWLIDASVSFTKGCYTGQELVARIDSRGGNAPRPVRGLRISGPAEIGSAVTSVDGRPLGALTSACFVEGTGETVALAPLARAVEPPAHVLVGGAEARVVELPMR